MKKNLLRELILPAFWLFFFIVSSNSNAKDNELKKDNTTEVKKQDISEAGVKDTNKEATFIKAVYLSEF